MSSGDGSVVPQPDKYAQSKLTSDDSITAWTGPEQVRELYRWTHTESGTVVEVSARAGDAAHRDEQMWLVIVRPGKNDPGRRITRAPLFTREAAFERARQFVTDHPDGDLPTTSYDEWGVET